MPVVLGAERELTGRPGAVQRDQPQSLAIPVEAGGDGLKRHDRLPAVGRETRLRGHTEAVQVIGTRGARHGDPPAVGTSAV
jgi:hypothetical protein